MDYLFGFLMLLASFLLTAVIFGFIFIYINKKSQIFLPLQRLAGKAKRKKLLKYIIQIAACLISTAIYEIFDLNSIEWGILLGILIALADNIFEPARKPV
jgi:hypothetical protein